MNRISITNPSLRKYESSELTSDASAGSDVSLSVKNNQGFSVDDLILVSKKGYEKSEVCQIKTITGNTTIVVHTLKLGHTEGTEIRMVPYDKVKLYSSSTETGTYTAVGDWVDIDYDNMMTYIDDSSGDDDTWYKAKFRHSISAVESTLSDAFQVTDAGYYCTISEVLDEAGMIDNRYVDNEFVNRCRRRAQLEVDGSLYGMRIADAKSLQEMYIQTRHDGLGDEVKRRILMGNYALSSGHKDAFYNKADRIRAMIRAEFENAFKEVDLLLSPTSPSLPFKIGEVTNDPLAEYMADYFTVPNCITGNPALSIPCGFSKENLPIGFQFIGPRLSEELIYQVAYAFEQSTDYHLKVPKGFED